MKIPSKKHENSIKKAGEFHQRYEKSILMKIPAEEGEYHQKYENSRKNAENFNKIEKIPSKV
jgi:hypothetical protein